MSQRFSLYSHPRVLIFSILTLPCPIGCSVFDTFFDNNTASTLPYGFGIVRAGFSAISPWPNPEQIRRTRFKGERLFRTRWRGGISDIIGDERNGDGYDAGTLEAELLKLGEVADAADMVYTKATIGVASHQTGFELKTAVQQSSPPPTVYLAD